MNTPRKIEPILAATRPDTGEIQCIDCLNEYFSINDRTLITGHGWSEVKSIPEHAQCGGCGARRRRAGSADMRSVGPPYWKKLTGLEAMGFAVAHAKKTKRRCKCRAPSHLCKCKEKKHDTQTGGAR